MGAKKNIGRQTKTKSNNYLFKINKLLFDKRRYWSFQFMCESHFKREGKLCVLSIFFCWILLPFQVFSVSNVHWKFSSFLLRWNWKQKRIRMTWESEGTIMLQMALPLISSLNDLSLYAPSEFKSFDISSQIQWYLDVISTWTN